MATQEFILELMRFGAVYYCHVMPPPQDATGLSQEQLQAVLQAREQGRRTWGKNAQLQVPRRVFQDVTVQPGGYARVHVHPKRFPAAHTVDWARRVLVDAPEYVVVNKPAGVQVPPTVDNVLESVIACVARALSLDASQLRNTHRLDVGTEGVVVLAKTQRFANYFGTLLQDKAGGVTKLYRCLAAAPPPVGTHVHHVTVGQREMGQSAHTKVLEDGTSGGQRCELDVVGVEWVQLTGAAAQEWGSGAYEVTINLKTGRTHQIRAQLGALGCPLLGDPMYGANGNNTVDGRPADPSAGGPSAADVVPVRQHNQGAANISVLLHGALQPAAVDLLQRPNSLSAPPPADRPLPSPARSDQDEQLAVVSTGSHALTAADASSRGSPDGEQPCSNRHATAAAAAVPLVRDSPAATSTVSEDRWHPDRSRPVALQAYKLIVHCDGPLGPAPQVFDAGVPWWRAVGDDEEGVMKQESAAS